MPEYRIPEENLDWLKDKIAKIQKKAKKLGCEVVKFEIVSSEMVDGKDGSYKIYTVKVEGQAPVIAGWVFVAKIEHLPQGNVVNVLPNQELPTQYRDASPNCDHCQTYRMRNNTFVVVKDGQYKQVGSSCLVDFLGHPNPESVADAAQWIEELTQACEEAVYDPDRMYGSSYVRIDKYLSYVAMAIRKWGFVSKGKASEMMAVPTSSEAFTLMNKRTDHEYPCEKDNLLADLTIKWVREELASRDNLSDYEHNLVVIFSEGYMETWHAGYVASAIVAYKREEEKKNTVVAESQYVGQIKKRQEFHNLYLVSVKTIEGFYGTTWLHKFQDENGNIIIWFSSSVELEEGQTYNGKATPKEHKEYHGTKQTIITRFKEI